MPKATPPPPPIPSRAGGRWAAAASRSRSPSRTRLDGCRCCRTAHRWTRLSRSAARQAAQTRSTTPKDRSRRSPTPTTCGASSRRPLPIDTICCVIGYARQRLDQAALEIARDARARIFAISLRGQDAIGSGYRLATILLGLCGLAVALGTGRLASNDDTLVAALVGAGACYLGAVALGWLWLAHNSLVELRQRVHQGWANVDVQLAKRFDLDPRAHAAGGGARQP